MADVVLVDPLGRAIHLHEHTWLKHVLVGHPDLAPHRQRVVRSIIQPSLICFSSSAADCRLYYDLADRGGIMICVVADVVAGIVKTAYRTRKVKTGAVEWHA